MMIVDVKSRIESTRDARTEREDELKVTMILATSRKTFARKLISNAKFTILELMPSPAPRISADSSSKETARDCVLELSSDGLRDVDSET
jgi:hypothetical protein